MTGTSSGKLNLGRKLYDGFMAAQLRCLTDNDPHWANVASLLHFEGAR